MRIPEKTKPGILARLTFWVSQRMYGRVADPLRLYSHHPTVLFGTSIYELAQQRANHLEPRLKTLVQLQVARMVGCPW